ncbi:peroxisomal hydratase-dehydrogenase-epimerase-like [Stylophora pistillata]|uniref:peroxisomal hydratase-dehydrogenase-epimerase-like n=1 Tax=Stylophora pistillata TaxID=50429 RepID=UPI000C03E56E|nr:peroxisomal hydratase-dehydrogenase-epimerase-like [Stylophora pistillata]
MSESTGNETQKEQGVDVTSDLEGELNTTSFMRNTMVSSTMVSGEASETDDEDEDDEENPGNVKEDEDLANREDENLKEEGDADTDILESELDTNAGKAKRQKTVYKFDSPFHRKLRERISLKSN